MQADTILSFFSKYIEAELGIVYAEHNLFQLQNRIEEVAKTLGLESTTALYEKALGGITGQFRQMLLDIATNNETSFFRDQKAFEALEKVVFTKVIEKSPIFPTFSIWSAASSSGQEALSLAMQVLEWNTKNCKKIDFKITGTDISDRVLSKAKSGQYSLMEVQRGLNVSLLQKYFKKDVNENWTANDSLTRRIEYKSLNLIEPFQFSQQFDLILCRNVLIYQNVERKKDILRRITSFLAPSGVLVLGSGESVIGLSDDFTQLIVDGAVLYIKK